MTHALGDRAQQTQLLYWSPVDKRVVALISSNVFKSWVACYQDTQTRTRSYVSFHQLDCHVRYPTSWQPPKQSLVIVSVANSLAISLLFRIEHLWLDSVERLWLIVIKCSVSEIQGLDNLHEYLKFSYTRMRAPSFFCENESSTGLTLHYRSKRRGFVYYTMGQIKQVCRPFTQRLSSVFTPRSIQLIVYFTIRSVKSSTTRRWASKSSRKRWSSTCTSSRSVWNSTIELSPHSRPWTVKTNVYRWRPPSLSTFSRSAFSSGNILFISPHSFFLSNQQRLVCALDE